MNLEGVNSGVHRNRSRRRLGRGIGSGLGKTAGSGHKGQRSRHGYHALPIYEGGQMPLVRRIPKRGFNNRFADTVAIVNVGDIELRFESGEEVNPATLKERGLVKGQYDALKILADGELTKPLKISAHKLSAGAKEKIEKAGGTITILPGRAPLVKHQKKERPAKVGAEKPASDKPANKIAGK
jgi:large subunit ribosomal protein L15